MGVLDVVTSWDVDRAAAAVVGEPGSVLGTVGPGRERFGLASVTKLVTTMAILVAVEEGSVDLDGPAGPPGATLRHLLAHASGLAFDQAVVIARPATRRIYSNVGIEQAAALVEQRTGLAFATYLQEAVLDPLAMGDSTLDGSPATSLTSTIEDMTRFAAELLRPTLVSDTTLASAVEVAFPGLAGRLPGIGPQDPNDWGLGFELRDHKSPHWTGTGNSSATFGHFGGTGTFLWVDPSVRVACIVLTNRDFGPWAVEAWPSLSDEVVDAIKSRGSVPI